MNTSLAAGAVLVTATRGTFGLVVGAAGVAFELQGGFSAAIPGLTVSAGNAAVKYASAGMAIVAGRQLAIGSAQYTFSSGIAADSFAFSVQGFQADIAGFTAISGNLGFAVAGANLVTVGSNFSAGYIHPEFGGLRVENAAFGLVSGKSGAAFELGGAACGCRSPG